MLQVAEREMLPRAKPGKEVTHENPVYSELLLKDETPPAEAQEDASDLQVA
jgi:hypothetical protein